jgi:hypothetical protein
LDFLLLERGKHFRVVLNSMLLSESLGQLNFGLFKFFSFFERGEMGWGKG